MILEGRDQVLRFKFLGPGSARARFAATFARDDIAFAQHQQLTHIFSPILLLLASGKTKVIDAHAGCGTLKFGAILPRAWYQMLGNQRFG